jgi:predicted ATPase
MLRTLAVANYRSVRDLVLPLAGLNLVTGANGCGKSNLYRGLRLLAESAYGNANRAIALEGGLASVLWAGPETLSRGVKQGRQPVQGGPRQQPVSLRLGFAGDELGYAVDFGLPTPVPGTMFVQDPEIKREVIWYGERFDERSALVDRKGPMVRARDDAGRWQVIEQHVPAFESMLTWAADPMSAPEVVRLREELRSWRFYDHFRCDAQSPARQPQVGVRTPVLSNDGHDLAAAWQTIREIGDETAQQVAVNDAFPGASVEISESSGRYELHFSQPGLLRSLSQAELSDGTLRYLLLIAALNTPRPPPLMVLNEPETSLHPDLLAPLGRLMKRYARDNQLWVVSHAPLLIEELVAEPSTSHLQLDKELGETFLHDQSLFAAPAWKWPAR